MSKWYISIDSKARGPFSEGQLREKIMNGDLFGETLVYKEGDLDWLPLSQQSLWSPMLKKEEGFDFISSTKDSKVWVLLIENPLKKGDFLQEGPFNQQSVIERFDEGELQETDYVWKPGMDKWQMLKDMPELVMTRKQATSFTEPELNEVYAANLNVSNNEETPAPLFEAHADMPVFIEPYSKREAEGEGFKNLLPYKNRSLKPFKVKRLPSLVKDLSYKKEMKWFLLSIVFVFIFALGIGLSKPAMFTSFKNAKRSVYSFFSASYTASYLMISPSIVDKKVIRFRTDAKEGAVVKVRVFDLAGRKMRLNNSSKRSASVTIDAVGIGEVDLSKFSLKPFKNYTVTAKMGGLEAKKSVIYVP